MNIPYYRATIKEKDMNLLSLDVTLGNARSKIQCKHDLISNTIFPYAIY